MFDSFIAGAKNNAKAIQDLCETQRTNRIESSKQQLLSPDFKGVRTDKMLIEHLNSPEYIDPRNNLCVWARPTKAIADVVVEIQKELRAIAPGLWTTPPSCLHMTVLEIVHTQTPKSLAMYATKLRPCLKELVNYPIEHRTRLIKPKLSFDDAAVALSFVPAAGEGRDSVDDDAFTYIHLRRDLTEICRRNGVDVAARYWTTSSHLTVARFITDQDHRDKSAIEVWIAKLESLNVWLEGQWNSKLGHSGDDRAGCEWCVGAERGLEIRAGRLWYGGGETIESGTYF